MTDHLGPSHRSSRRQSPRSVLPDRTAAATRHSRGSICQPGRLSAQRLLDVRGDGLPSCESRRASATGGRDTVQAGSIRPAIAIAIAMRNASAHDALPALLAASGPSSSASVPASASRRRSIADDGRQRLQRMRGHRLHRRLHRVAAARSQSMPRRSRPRLSASSGEDGSMAARGRPAMHRCRAAARRGRASSCINARCAPIDAFATAVRWLAQPRSRLRARRRSSRRVTSMRDRSGKRAQEIAAAIERALEAGQRLALEDQRFLGAAVIQQRLGARHRVDRAQHFRAAGVLHPAFGQLIGLSRPPRPRLRTSPPPRNTTSARTIRCSIAINRASSSRPSAIDLAESSAIARSCRSPSAG